MSSFNNSARREDVSLKLRSQNMRQTREQTKKLEEESRKMEDRLKELKTAMSREKEERERQGGGFWGRGQTSTGSLTSYASEVLQSKVEKPAKEGKKKKIKILQDEPIEVPKRSSQPGTVKYIAQRKLTSGSTPRDKQKGPKCGQCEERSATLSCVQCSEIYCAGCFAAFHLKGALKQHRSCPISAVGGRVCMSPRPSVDASSPRGSQASGSVVSYPKPTYSADGSEASGPRSAQATPRQGDGASLLQGDYDESQSAASFQNALMAWRQGEDTVSPQHSARKAPPRPIASPVKDPVVSMDSSTGTTEETRVPDIKFTGSLSYVEKLMLKKHRRTELSETGTPRLTDQSESSSRLSNHSDWSSVSRHSHQRERIANRRDDAVASPLSRRSYRGQEDREQPGHIREQSFLDDGERVDFQSLYEAVVSTEGSGVNTPRSDFSIVDVTNVTSSTRPAPTTEMDDGPYDTGGMGDVSSRLFPARYVASKCEGDSAVFPDSSTYDMPNSKYTIEDMYPSQQPASPQEQNSYVEEDSWDGFRPTPTPSSFLDCDQSLTNGSPRKRKQEQQMPSSPSNEMFSPPSANQVTATATQSQGEITRSKSSKSKSARPKTASKSRPTSRAQSRAASRLMMADGLLTKTPSQALSEIAKLATNDDVTTPTALTYQSPLEGFFLAGVDMAALAQQSDKLPEDRTITPRKYSSSTSLTQRPKSRSGPASVKSARGEREAIKVSNRLYQMAPRSWRPDSSLGETIPLDNVRIEDEGEKMVLSYSYGSQMSGQATEWRPSSSQSSIPADNQFETELNLIQQSSSHHPHSGSHAHTGKPMTRSNASSRTHTPDLLGQGDSQSQQQPMPSPKPPTLPPSDGVASSSSILRRKSANRRSLGASSPLPTPTPVTPQIPSASKIPTNRNPRPLSSTSASENKSKQSMDTSPQSHDTNTGAISRPSKNSQLIANLLPSKSEIAFTSARSKSKMSSENDPSPMSRSNTQTSGIVRSGSHMTRVDPSRPSSKNSMSGRGDNNLSRRHSNADQTRPSSSTITPSGITKGQRAVLSASKGRPVSSTVSKDRSGHFPMTVSQSLDVEPRQDSIIADVMSTRVHADGWMMGDEDHDDADDGYDDNNNGGDDIHGSGMDVNRTLTSKKTPSDSSHWETEVRPFTRDSLDSAKVRRRGHVMSTRHSSTMSGRESRAIVMEGEDLSAYDTVLDPDETNQEDKQALEQLEWELASDTGRLTADGQISRMGVFDQDTDHSGSSSRSSSSRSLRFCADKDYDITSKLLEDERLAEQASLSVDLERNVTLDEDEVKALR